MILRPPADRAKISHEFGVVLLAISAIESASDSSHFFFSTTSLFDLVHREYVRRFADPRARKMAKVAGNTCGRLGTWPIDPGAS